MIVGHAPRAGFLGLELFERFAVQLDRKAKVVTLTPLEKFDGKHKAFGFRSVSRRMLLSPAGVSTEFPAILN